MLLQTRGATAFVLLTEPFRDQVDRVMAYYRSDRPLPVVVIDHPVQLLDEAGIKARARQLADKVQKILRGDPPDW